MNNPKQPGLPAKGRFLVYQSEDWRMKLEVRLENETVWLTQQQSPSTSVRSSRANGAATHQPRATPWELGTPAIYQP